ncbi:MAG: hypothetical protein R3302_08210 [Sulfurimonadaceae bacterium]|nr:hypothetical protein [Sulfurimonadaceae bacterium]
MLLRHLLISLMLLASVSIAETNTTQTHRIEVTVTVAGMQETANSIQQTSQQVAALTERLSEKKEFTEEDHKLISELTNALNNHAVAVNNIANALPKQLEEIQGSAISILDHATGNVQQVVTTSKTDLVDPTLDRIQTQVLVFIILLGAILIGVIWFGLWQIRSIVATGSETISNITQTMKSVEKVVDKVNRAEERTDSN